jgi:hypothetical protein
MLKGQDRPEHGTTGSEVPTITTTSAAQQNDTGSPIMATGVDSTFENRFPPFPPKPAESGSWEMIGLGLEEPLPTQDAVNEL